MNAQTCAVPVSSKAYLYGHTLRNIPRRLRKAASLLENALAFMDACCDEDLQKLHAAVGEYLAQPASTRKALEDYLDAEGTIDE